MTNIVLAQINIAKMRYALDQPEMSGFVNNLDRINAIAEQSDGFIWRFLGDAEAEAAVFGDDVIVNMSTWANVASLHKFVYRTGHTDIMRQREKWFTPLETYSVMWWHENSAPPTLETANARLTLLADNGPGQDAFSFRHQFPSPIANG